MLPRAMEALRIQLSRWGYPHYLLNKMKPWSLLVAYNNEKIKRASPHKAKPTLDLSFDQEPVIPIKLKKTPKKYRGVLFQSKKP